MEDSQIKISLINSGNSYFASVEELVGDDEIMDIPLDLTGEGDSPLAAIEDLVKTIREY